jgi:hypothetical protein
MASAWIAWVLLSLAPLAKYSPATASSNRTTSPPKMIPILLSTLFSINPPFFLVCHPEPMFDVRQSEILEVIIISTGERRLPGSFL